MKHAYRIAGLGLLLGTAVSLGATAANARGPMAGFDGPGGPGARGEIFASAFTDLDKDGNGMITEDDLTVGAEARFTAVDTDGDGILSADELAASIKARMAERMQDGARRGGKMDADAMATRIAARMLAARDDNDDGVLSLEELAPGNGPGKGFARMIDRFDTDDDNAISEAEFETAKQEIDSRHVGRADRGGHGGGHGDHGGRGQSGGRW